MAPSRSERAGSAIQPPRESVTLTVGTAGPRTKKTGRAGPPSAGFAICSTRGMGEPHDFAPRDSWHLSTVRICAPARRRQVGEIHLGFYRTASRKEPDLTRRSFVKQVADEAESLWYSLPWRRHVG